MNKPTIILPDNKDPIVAKPNILLRTGHPQTKSITQANNKGIIPELDPCFTLPKTGNTPHRTANTVTISVTIDLQARKENCS